ncbi:MAG TPA: DUF4129 domain-containing protein, partial [Gaiellaceae bacterium]|nr:DUF4129 domain-containing protein [Gaiellaceae bacterium]
RRGGEGPVLEEARPQRWIDWWPALLLPLLVVSLITLLLALGELFGRPVASESPPQDASQPGGVPLPGAASGGDGTDWPVHWLVFAVLASVGGTVAGVLLVRDWRRRRREARSTAAGEELIVAIEESLADLEGEPDPRLAVIKAYGRMERALARAGTGRLPPETPLEYLARVLAAAQVSRASITGLTSLFQRAQFSRHAVDAAMKRQAIDALHDLRGELEHPGVPGATR